MDTYHVSVIGVFFMPIFKEVFNVEFVLKFGWTTSSMETMPIPSLDGWKISREKVWSSNAKRTSSAEFQGTLVDIKVTLDMTFPANTTPAEIKKILKYASPTGTKAELNQKKYCYIQFTNEKGEIETKRFYFGNPSFDAHVFLNGKMLWSSMQIQAVEK